MHSRAGELIVTHWELFALRDPDSTKHDLFHNFGVLRDDYSEKPAFDRLRRLFTGDRRRRRRPGAPVVHRWAKRSGVPVVQFAKGDVKEER
ncbi:hypothetical protein [Mycobacterium sp.]|uniref:hypothetical protein n=1 Tax=Mycobacterium sp. TaxID=1785 RepID=UPI003C776749